MASSNESSNAAVLTQMADDELSDPRLATPNDRTDSDGLDNGYACLFDPRVTDRARV